MIGVPCGPCGLRHVELLVSRPRSNASGGCPGGDNIYSVITTNNCIVLRIPPHCYAVLFVSAGRQRKGKGCIERFVVASDAVVPGLANCHRLAKKWRRNAAGIDHHESILCYTETITVTHIYTKVSL